MTATNQSVDDHFSGDTLRITVTVTDGDGNPYDLTGARIDWVLAPTPGGDAHVEKSTADGSITITDAAAGEFRVDLAPSDTQDRSGSYYHEAELEDSNGNEATILTGRFVIKEDTA